MNMKSRRFSLDSSVLEGVGHLGGKKGNHLFFSGRKPRQSQTLEDDRPEIQELKNSLSSNLPPRAPTITESLHPTDGPIRNHSFQKHNKSFHKLFPEIHEDEKLTHSFSCALQKEVLYHGRLFVSENHVCFHSSVLLKDTKVVIPVSSVQEVKRHNSALSMLSVQTANKEKYSFVSLRGREICYKLLQRVCAHAKGWSANSSPVLSSAENEADQMSSYSSLEDCPRHDSSPDLPPLSSDLSTSHNPTRHNSLANEEDKDKGRNWSVVETFQSLGLFREIENVRVLFLIYVILLGMLVVVSGYVGLRVLALEEQLNCMESMTDLSSDHRCRET